MAIASGTCGTCSWNISDSGVLTIGSGTLEPPALIIISNSWPWGEYKTQITSAVISSGVVVGDAAPFMGEAGPPTISAMFEGCSSMTSLTFQGSFDTSRVETADLMFWNCSSLTSLDLSVLDTRKVTNMGLMFWMCPLLTSVKLGSLFDTSALNENSGPGLVADKEFPSAVNTTNGIVVTSASDFDSLSMSQHNGVWLRRAAAETFAVTAVRSDGGVEDEDGEDAKINVTWVTGSSASDRLIRVYMKRAENPTYPSSPETVKYLSGNSGVTDIIISGIGDHAYDFQVEFYDGENTYISFPSVSSNIRLVTISPDGVPSCHNMNGDFGTLFDLIYPVGCYFETSDANFNPAHVWGGTWILETAGMVHVSGGAGYSVSKANNADGAGEQDGGNKDAIVPYHNHSFTNPTISSSGGGGATEGPSNNTSGNGGAHSGTVDFRLWGTGHMITGASGAFSQSDVSTSANAIATASNNPKKVQRVTLSVGNHTHGLSSHTHKIPNHSHTLNNNASVGYAGTSGNTQIANMQPYINVYRWHRTA